MKRSVRRFRLFAIVVALLVLAMAVAVWFGAVEFWVSKELRSLAAACLKPKFTFDDLKYTFPRRINLSNVRFTSPDPEASGESIEILTLDSLELVLSGIPLPNRVFRMQQLDVAHPTINLVRIPTGPESGELLGFSDLLTETSDHGACYVRRSSAKLSDHFQVRAVSIEDGRAQYDSRDGSAALMLIDGISANLTLQPKDAGEYGIDFSLDHHPTLTIALRGTLQADEKRLEIAALSGSLQLAREHDHYLTPRMQKIISDGDITADLTLAATGTFDLDSPASTKLHADIELDGANYAAGRYQLPIDHIASQISVSGKTVTIEKFVIDALRGHAKIGGTFELDDTLQGALTFEGAELQIGDLLRASDDSAALPAFEGLLGFAGTLQGPLAEIDQQADGEGRLSLDKARVGRLPVLETINEELDRTAEASMKKEHVGHDVLSLEFSLEGDHARIRKLRMNSRWYGLRGHGRTYFDSRLDLAVDGGPIQRLENELGVLGDVLGEITETIVRARVTGTLDDPKIGIEVLRQRLGR